MLISFKGKAPAGNKAAFIAPDAVLVGDVTLGKNSSVWFGAVLRADNASIVIGDESNIQDNAVCHVDPGLSLSVGRRVTVGHSAVLHGCTVGDNTIIGMGAVILNKAVIGENSIVGAGALVPEEAHFPPASLIVGNPAVVKKSLKELYFRKIGEAAEKYAEHAREMAAAVNGHWPDNINNCGADDTEKT